MTTPPLVPNSTVIKYAQQAPRYTSYPTALKFSQVPANALNEASWKYGTDDLALYIHIPFCDTLCYYCGCNKTVTRHNDKADDYLSYLEQEMLLKKPLYDGKKVVSLHLGGGSPSFLSSVQQTYLMYLLRRHFTFSTQTEMSIELDPRHTTEAYLSLLAELGYNRVSFGVQDTDIEVQKAINRVQSTSHIANMVLEAKNKGFSSVNIDLIYGLPKQTLETFSKTLMAAKAMRPDRVALFSYAHLPERFAAQRKIPHSTLPSAEMKAQLYQLAVDSFTEAGYDMLGLDHFASQSDELSRAKNNGTLHRNFQGYTTLGQADSLGLGVSAISTIGDAYVQNPKKIKDYYHKIDNQLPLAEKGVLLTKDDLVRRSVIMSLMCNLSVNIKDIESRYALCFNDYFESELEALTPLAKDNLVHVGENEIRVPEAARIYIRAVCARFDAYLNKQYTLTGYSSAI